MPKSPTTNGTRKLSEIARYVVPPHGITGTGWPAVQAKSLEMGVRFRPWQVPVGRLILAKRGNGKYAATIGGTGLSIPRQVGKTFLVAAIVFALCLLRPGLTVVWTAHRLSTAEETFGKLRTFAKRRKIAPFIQQVFTGSGDEEIRFRNGSRILFGARERGFGRGFDEVDVLIFDEAQILGDAALDDMIPATNQSRQDTGALLLYMGTPPKPGDKGEAFTRMRADALSGEDRDTGWVEFGADPGYKPTDPPGELTAADWAQVAKANPSYPLDTPREAILRMRKKLGPESFLREGLGIWDERPGGGALDVTAWKSLAADPPPLARPLAWGVDLDEGGVGTVAVAWRRPDRRIHAQLVSRSTETPDELRFTATQMGPRVKELRRKHGGKVWAGGGAASLLDDASIVSGPEFAAACETVADLLGSSGLLHCAQDDLDVSVESAQWRSVGTAGQRAWKLKDATGVGPLAALTRAIHGLVSIPTEPPPPPVGVKTTTATSDVDLIHF